MRCPTLDMKGLARLNRIIWWSSLGVAFMHLLIAASDGNVSYATFALFMMAYATVSRTWLHRAESAEEFIEELAWPKEEDNNDSETKGDTK